MLFNSYSFMLFFPIVLLVYFIIPKKIRYIWLLAASYFFYMCWNVKYVVLIMLSTAITWISARLMQGRTIKVRRNILVISLLSNLGILAFFKYFNFFVENMNWVLQKTGIRVIDNPFNLILPVGISFYTFQALSYIIDVYRNEIEPEKNFFRYALFVSFFPQLVAGPIERSKNLLRQVNSLEKIKLWNYDRITYGAGIMLWGYFLKMVVADRLAVLVDTVWNEYWKYGSCELILAAVFFSIQIYCDFNSYSTIAAGAAKIMGIDLMENFNTPYFSRSIKEFWRRWHISLSIWFRDYVYIPLGGSRCSAVRKYFNLTVTFLISGLWHGANWTYVLWGGIHGLYQIAGAWKKKYIDQFNKKFQTKTNSFSYKLGQVIVTFCLTTIAWIFFRSASITEAFDFLYRMFTRWDLWVIFKGVYQNCGLNTMQFTIAVLSIMVLLTVDCIKYKTEKDVIQFLNTQTLWFRWGVYIVIFMAVLIFGIYGPDVDAAQFIYFQF